MALEQALGTTSMKSSARWIYSKSSLNSFLNASISSSGVYHAVNLSKLGSSSLCYTGTFTLISL